MKQRSNQSKLSKTLSSVKFSDVNGDAGKTPEPPVVQVFLRVPIELDRRVRALAGSLRTSPKAVWVSAMLANLEALEGGRGARQLR